MSDAHVKAFLRHWVAQMGLAPMEALAEIIWVHAGIEPPPAYWPQMHRIMQNLATDL